MRTIVISFFVLTALVAMPLALLSVWHLPHGIIEIYNRIGSAHTPLRFNVGLVAFNIVSIVFFSVLLLRGASFLRFRCTAQPVVILAFANLAVAVIAYAWIALLVSQFPD